MKVVKISKKTRIIFEPSRLKEDSISRAYEIIVPIFPYSILDQHIRNEEVEEKKDGKKSSEIY